MAVVGGDIGRNQLWQYWRKDVVNSCFGVDSYLDHFCHGVRFVADLRMQEPYELVNVSTEPEDTGTEND